MSYKPDVEELAQRIRKLWAEERRAFDLRTTGVVTDWGNRHISEWDGGVKDGRSYNATWPKIAELCIENHLDPLLLVRATFYRKEMAPNPNQAVGRTALDRYQMYVAPGTVLEIKNSLLNALDCNKSLAQSEVVRQKTYFDRDDVGAWRMTLLSSSVNLSPLFRYCVAKSQGWDDIAEDFEATAQRQYAQNPMLYDEAWAALIPEDLRTQKHQEVQV